MCLRIAAAAALLAALLAGLPASATEPLTLDDAFARVDQSHPELRLITGQRDVFAAELDRAAFKPPLVIGAEVENVFGTGAASGLSGAELTLTLASVLERGGKLDARRAVAQSRIDALSLQRETRRLDLLAEVARRYLAVVSAKKQREIADLDIGQRRRTVAGAQHRLQAGASPESVVLTAEAALARAELEHARATQQEAAARQHLAAMWGERNPTFEAATVDPLGLPPVASFDELADWLSRTPEIAQLAGEQRIREARLQLAQTQATPDLDWQVGVRRYAPAFEQLGDVYQGLRSGASASIRICNAGREKVSSSIGKL